MAVYRRTHRRRSVLVLLVLTSITLITLDTRDNGGGVTSRVRDRAQDLMAPVQNAVDDVLAPVADWFDGITRRGELKRENVELRRALAKARGDAATSKGALLENEQLRALAKLPFVLALRGIDAQVVAGSPGNFESTVGIDKGRDVGVARGMPVVAGDGLVGRVTDASGRRATVLLLTDPKSGVSVRLEHSGALGVANGRSGSDLLRLTFVKSEVAVKRGELVFTSGLENGVYPANIPVGKVVSVKKEPGALEQTIMVKPLVDVGRLSFVRVLEWPIQRRNG